MKERLRVEEGKMIFVPNGVVVGDVYREVDGYYVFWPTRTGFWESGMLRAIADTLDEMNKPWDDEVRAYFENNEPLEG